MRSTERIMVKVYIRCTRKSPYHKACTFPFNCSLLHSIFRLILLVSITFSLYFCVHLCTHIHTCAVTYICLYFLSHLLKLCGCKKVITWYSKQFQSTSFTTEIEQWFLMILYWRLCICYK